MIWSAICRIAASNDAACNNSNINLIKYYYNYSEFQSWLQLHQKMRQPPTGQAEMSGRLNFQELEWLLQIRTRP